MTDDTTTTTHTINESADKIRLKTAITRGEGTREQEKVTVKVKGDDPEKVVADFAETVARVEPVIDDLRAIEPEADDE